LKLQVAPYNNTAGTWTEAEETAFLHYQPTHGFDNPAEVIITLADPTGAIARKYNVDANDVYVGPGKVTIEDPTGTDIFYGRIMKATANTDDRTVELYCQDWLSQLDEEQITYDMREKLSGNVRQSTAHSDPDNGTYVGPAYTSGLAYYMYDDTMNWGADVWNGFYLVFTSGMAGTISCETGPYDEVVTGDGAGIDSDLGDETDLWVDDTNYHVVWDNDENWTQDYYFRVYLGHNTPSDFYVHDSISAAMFDVSYVFKDDDADATCEIQIYDITAAAWQNIGDLVTYDAQRGQILTRVTINIPDEWVDDCVDANGIAKVRFNVTKGTTNAYLYIHYIKFKVTVETTGHSSAIKQNGNTSNRLFSSGADEGVDLTAAATRIWEGIPYCITKKIYKHIESATGPVLGYDSMVTLTCADANVENTSGISTRQYVNKTPLEILQDLARQDKAHVWIALGTTTVTYKSTFNDDSPETLTDADINAWHSTFDYSTLVNEVTAYGIRIGDKRLSSTYTDTTSEGKYKQTRTKITNDTGLVSEYDTLARATAICNQYKDVQQILTATIRGNTAKATHDKTLVLGDEVSITSTYLGLSASVYIVQRWSYDSQNNLTTLLLHPRVSAIGLQRDERPSFEQVMQANRRGTADRYIAAPESNEVA